MHPENRPNTSLSRLHHRPTSNASKFGIDRNKSAVLGIPATPARFGYLRTAFKALEQEYLDVALPPSAQNTALDKIRAKLEKEFPDLFDKDDKEKKLYLAVQAVCEILYAKRRRNASLGKNRDPNFIDMSDVKSDSDGSDEYDPESNGTF
ncbi:hypothetical protein CPB84DRAFT_1750511 [Gymnopilus junonius]|uniref:Uncharacterized protein n=1 Tax=Gymnopilus junonius TaxID=109634 RepID=A0A9P5NER5_GYMJU|nr:hypothetical protein CPB84DRAFT_1750511 [Gymnopilus junonius]